MFVKRVELWVISRLGVLLVLQGKRRVAKFHVVDSIAAVIRLLGY